MLNFVYLFKGPMVALHHPRTFACIICQLFHRCRTCAGLSFCSTCPQVESHCCRYRTRSQTFSLTNLNLIISTTEFWERGYFLGPIAYQAIIPELSSFVSKNGWYVECKKKRYITLKIYDVTFHEQYCFKVLAVVGVLKLLDPLIILISLQFKTTNGKLICLAEDIFCNCLFLVAMGLNETLAISM